jgi:hypothetical protein
VEAVTRPSFRIVLNLDTNGMRSERDLYAFRCELDSHADTCVAGPNCLKISEEGTKVKVYGYDRSKASEDIPIATVATLWNDPDDGQPYILVIHEALYFGEKIKDTLLNPNQLRANGLIVEEVPCQYDEQSRHSIIDEREGLTIPLDMNGVFSGFNSRKPTHAEYREYPHVILTS